MQTAWRIVRKKYSDSALSGLGAEKYGGRWNSKGRKVVYTSDSLALAALEVLVHLPYPAPPDFHKHCSFCALRVEIPDEQIRTVDITQLPEDWMSEPPGPNSKRIGDHWMRENVSLALKLPSVLVPLEHTILINPDHAEFNSLKVDSPIPYSLDSRLVPYYSTSK